MCYVLQEAASSCGSHSDFFKNLGNADRGSVSQDYRFIAPSI
jgi:hypothetical protein